MRNREPLTLGDYILWALLILVVLLIYLCAIGCRHSTPLPDPCPEPRVQEVLIDRPCVIVVEPLGDLALPEYPTNPGHDADEEEWKAWALKVAEVTDQREALLRARVAAWVRKIEEHNALEPRCKP